MSSIQPLEALSTSDGRWLDTFRLLFGAHIEHIECEMRNPRSYDMTMLIIRLRGRHIYGQTSPQHYKLGGVSSKFEAAGHYAVLQRSIQPSSKPLLYAVA